MTAYQNHSRNEIAHLGDNSILLLAQSRCISSLDFVETSLRTNSPVELSKSESDSLLGSLNILRSGSAIDSLHWIAVIGEFSAGKSTLINAFLSEPLLCSRSLVATAAQTHLLHGDICCVTAIWKRGARKSGRPAAPPAGADLGTMRAFLRDVTAGPWAAQIDRVDIQHPASALRGLRLIDTPGANASEEHTEITRRVVADAHSLLVVLNATSAMSMSLCSFLRDVTASTDLLQRAVFVVSRMDQVDTDEQDDLLEFIRGAIRTALGIDHPTVVASFNAQVVGGGSDVPPQERELWTGRFAQTQLAILNHLRDAKRDAFASALRRQTVLLLDTLNQATETQAAVIRNTRWPETSTSATLADAETIARDACIDAQAAITAAAGSASKKIAKAIARERAAAQLAVTRGLNGCADWDAMYSYLTRLPGAPAGAAAAPGAAADVSQHLDRADAEIDRALAAISGSLSSASAMIRQAFADTYPDLPLGRVSRRTRGEKSGALRPERGGARIDFGRLERVKKHGAVASRTRGGAAAAGAAVGTVIAPGIGTVIGGLIGFFASGAVDNRQENTSARRDDIREEALAHIDAAFDTLLADGRQVIDESEADARARVSALADQRAQAISIVVESRRRQRREIERERGAWEASLIAFRAELDERRASLLAPHRPHEHR